MASDQIDRTEQKPLTEKTDAELKRETKARLKHMSPAAAGEVFEELLDSPVAEPIIGFFDFLREKAVVGLAVGFVVGAQVQSVANQIIKNIIEPLFGLILPGDGKLNERSAHLRLGAHAATFGWGAVLYALLDFMFVLLVLYVMVKLLGLDRLDKKKLG